MSKSSDKANRRSALIVGLISSAGTLGYTEAGSTADVVKAAAKLVPSNYLTLIAEGASDAEKERAKQFAPYIRDFGLEYQSAHVARYLEERGGRSYSNRWGNYDITQKIAAGREIMDKAEPESEKSNRRTVLEQSAVKAAQNRWKYVKEQAGLKLSPKPRAKTGTQQLKAAAGTEKVPVSHLTVPKMHAPVEAIEFFDRLSKDALAGVNANALAVPIALKSAVQDFRKAVREAISQLKAGEKRAATAKRDKSTVSVAEVAAKQQRIANAAASNGASN
jgi:hypothetical protein